ncbi:MAG: hypothetical protein KDA61_09570 [Planctomycetales bacterium]|nr:hypothetical protein [Planctomycetales bacterium]
MAQRNSCPTPSNDFAAVNSHAPGSAAVAAADALAWREEIDGFCAHYGYDGQYMHDLLARSARSFSAFRSAMELTKRRSSLPVEAHFTATITVMQHEDCGSCLQLNLDMALEAGVSSTTVRQIIESSADLPAVLCDVRTHTLGALGAIPQEFGAFKRIEAAYGAEAVGELAIAIAGARMYPTIKRALHRATSCTSPRFEPMP